MRGLQRVQHASNNVTTSGQSESEVAGAHYTCHAAHNALKDLSVKIVYHRTTALIEGHVLVR